MSSLITRNGVWYLTYYIDGKQVWKSLKTKDKASAKVLRRKFDAEFDQVKSGITPGKVRITDAFDMFLARKKTVVKPNTLVRYQQSLANIRGFCDHAGLSNINDLQPRHVNDYLAFRKKRATKTICEELLVLKGVISMLIEDGLLSTSPIRKWPRLKTTTTTPDRIGSYTAEEIGKLKTYFKNLPTWDIFLFMLYTGCRRGEMAALRNGDINIAENYIRLPNLKTATGVSNQFRTIEIHPELLPAIKSRSQGKTTDLVFPEVLDNVTSWLTKIVMKACRVTGITYKRLHGLRHTFISSLLNNGVAVRAVQAMVGHQNIQTTMRYSHISQDEMRGKINKLGY